MSKEVIEKTKAYVQQELAQAEGGHDWYHIERVRKTAIYIGVGEPVSLYVVELGALLHDIADYKFHDGDEDIGPRKAREFLERLGVEEKVVDHVENIVRHISYKGEAHQQPWRSPELDVVQDADRLDAIGAIGIARAFNYGGHKGFPLWLPKKPPRKGMTKEEYKKATGSTINHFPEKLLLLKDLMNTTTGKQLAQQRHTFMEYYLQQFFAEWKGTR